LGRFEATEEQRPISQVASAEEAALLFNQELSEDASTRPLNNSNQKGWPLRRKAGESLLRNWGLEFSGERERKVENRWIGAGRVGS